MTRAGEARVAVDGPLSDQAVDDLARWTSRCTGFALETFQRAGIERAARTLLQSGVSVGEMTEALALRRADIVQTFGRAVCVCETYFFRQLDHFEQIAVDVLRARVASGATTLRAWSAGCATGEEAYSLAACLTADAPGTGLRIEVLGTDLLDSNIHTAARGQYGPWSSRTSSPHGYQLFEPPQDGAVRVLERLRRVTEFRTHNLLDAPPTEAGLFDLVFCRNVLGYMSPEASIEVCRRLAEAVAPGGVLVFATLDSVTLPQDYRSVGRPELNAFQRDARRSAPAPRPTIDDPARPLGGSSRRRSTLPPPRERRRSAPPRTKQTGAMGTAVALHRQALELVDRGERHAASLLLTKLRAVAPDYLPGMFELALIHARAGRRAAAASSMQQILEKTHSASPSTLVEGVSDLPVGYYRTAACAYLELGRPKKRL